MAGSPRGLLEGGDRVALVTGAGQGIGLAIAASLLADGHRVALLDLDVERAGDAAAALDPSGERTLALGANVGKPAEVEAALDALVARWGWPAILVNNAARTVARPVLEIPLEEWDDVLATNLRSCLLLCQRCAPSMRAAGWGRIVNMASLAGQQGGVTGGAHYAASKAGMIVLSKVLAREMASDGVTVNAVAPAAILTPVMESLGAERIAEIAEGIPIGRPGTSEEVASMVSYLCSNGAAFVTGATLDVNGGLSMR
ncbi:MAG TPA: SDR family NAD(P)-dependent oxidoreductase [Conexibacter sp.]